MIFSQYCNYIAKFGITECAIMPCHIMDAVDDTDNVVKYPMLKAQNNNFFNLSKYEKPKERFSKNINIDTADISESEISVTEYRYQQGDIDPALLRHAKLVIRDMPTFNRNHVTLQCSLWK